MAVILEGCSVAHSHGGGSGHGHQEHGHTHNGYPLRRDSLRRFSHNGYISNTSLVSDSSSPFYSRWCRCSCFQRCLKIQGCGSKAKDHNTNLIEADEEKQRKNLNIRAALIHAIGDLCQSIGVLISAILIYFKVLVTVSNFMANSVRVIQ